MVSCILKYFKLFIIVYYNVQLYNVQFLQAYFTIGMIEN